MGINTCHFEGSCEKEDCVRSTNIKYFHTYYNDFTWPREIVWITFAKQLVAVHFVGNRSGEDSGSFDKIQWYWKGYGHQHQFQIVPYRAY